MVQQMQLPSARQAITRTLRKRAFDIFLAVALALIFALLVDAWLHAPVALPACEAPLHFAVPKAAPRCLTHPAQFPA